MEKLAEGLLRDAQTGKILLIGSSKLFKSGAGFKKARKVFQKVDVEKKPAK